VCFDFLYNICVKHCWEIPVFLLTSNSLLFTSFHFPSLHFTYHFPDSLPTRIRFRGEVPKALIGKLKNKRPTWCHLLFYFTSYVFNKFRTLIYPSSGACDFSVQLPHWSYCSWFDVCWSFGVVGLEWYPCCRLKHILMSETYWAHKKWNKVASDIKLVFYSSTIKMMHGPINIRLIGSLFQSWMVVFTKEYFPLAVLCLLLPIFQSWLTLLR